MNTRAWMATGLLAVLAACSGTSGTSGTFTGSGTDGTTENGNGGNSGNSGNSGDDGGGGGNSGGGSGSGSLSGSSTGSASGSSSGANVADGGTGPGLLYDASAPDSDLGTPITLKMSPFTVTAANPEVYRCQWFGNPFGKDVDLVKMVGHMTAGSHHFFLFNMSPGTLQTKAAPLGTCPSGGLEIHPFPFLSQSPDWTVTYPQANLGYPIPSANGLMLNVHFLNTTGKDVTPTVSVTIYPAKPGVVTTKVGSLFLDNTNVSVPPGATMAKPATVSQTLAPITDEDYTIFTNWSHMHKYGFDFTASVGANVFFEDNIWDEPPIQTSVQNPMLPMAVKSGTQLTWKCLYTNPTSSTMTFGESATANDMCIYVGQYYPAHGTPSSNPNYPDVITPATYLP